MLDSINAAVIGPTVLFFRTTSAHRTWAGSTLCCKQLAQLTVQTIYCRQRLRRVQAHRMSANYHELVDANGTFTAL